MSPAPTPEIQTYAISDGVVVRPVGEVDLARSPYLRKALATANSAKPRRLIIDLSSVNYMDSSGVATLVEALRTAQRNSTKLVLAALQPRVRSIFEVARLETVFTIVDSAPLDETV